MNDSAAAHAALTAFLRGVERRGVVFAHWQAGSAAAGDAALAATLRGFGSVAGETPFAQWPRRFWALLLAAPQLREPPASPDPAIPAAVAALAPGPRAALLLRLVAGLPEAEAAAVLGIARPSYRLALRRALPHNDDGSPDPDAWRALSAAAQQAVRDLDGERLARIRSLRDGGRAPGPWPARSPVMHARRDWLWPATVVALLAVAAALAATWWGPWLPATVPDASKEIQGEPLPPARPAARFDPDAALATHPDLDLLLAEVAGGFPPDADPAFDAWLVQALAEGVDDGQAPLAPVAEADEGVVEDVDAP